MKNTVRKVLSLVLCVLLITAIVPFAYAEESPEDYPYVLVHGMMGWGEDKNEAQGKSYWGFAMSDVIGYMRSLGKEVYAPSIGQMSSAWDRACELYAMLTGTVVDYGEAHSAEYGHARYGRDYTGRALMGEAWDVSSPINIITHSFGGPTAIVFCSLLEYGCAEEVAASGGSCSELFKGGHEGAVYSVSTCESPTNGTQIADLAMDIPAVAMIFCMKLNSDASEGGLENDCGMDQWGISADPSTGETASFDFLKCMKLAISKDHAGYDMTIKGAAELNEKFPTAQHTYWMSYSACLPVTVSTLFGGAANGGNSFLNTTAALNSILAGKYSLRSGYISREWADSDGMVPVISAKAPFNAESVDYTDGMDMETGVWYVNPVYSGYGHGAHVGGDSAILYQRYDTIISEIANTAK